MAPCFWPAITLKPMRGRLPVFAHPCQRIGAAEARWAHNPKVLRSKLRFAILSLLSRLAQLVERKTLNLVVVGSIPTGGAFLDQGSELFRSRLLFIGAREKLRRHQISSMTPRTPRINRPHTPASRDSAGICPHATGA